MNPYYFLQDENVMFIGKQKCLLIRCALQRQNI